MTAEGEGRDNKDDLFEDLDKFFAPIQDVDWPEPVVKEEPAATESEEQEDGDERIDLPEAEDTGVLEQPAAPDEAIPSQTPGQAGLFAGGDAGEPEDGEETWPARDDAEAGSAGYETEPDISLESFQAPPPEYEDLPGPEEEEADVAPLEEDVAPLDEGIVESEAPSQEDVEAAAEHFAESVREERESVREPEEGEAGPFDVHGEPEEEVEEAILADLEEPGEGPRTVKVGGAEGLGGPSWQEPTSMEVGGDAERGPAQRDVPAAFLTGLVLAGLAIGSIAIGPAAFAFVAGAIVLLAQGEIYAAMHKRHFQPATALGLASGVLVLTAAYLRGEAALLSIVALSTFATFLWYMAVPAASRKHTLANVALTLFGIAYVPVLAGYAFALLKEPDGPELMLAVIGLTFVYDTAAFVVGYFWGSRPLAPTVSPKKSWEGAIGATLVVIAISVGVVASSVDLLDSVGRSVGLAVVVAVFAPLGDLAESLLKRDLGVKDMGSVLPGHGGVLDRIDSVLFVAPAAFMYLRLILL